MKTVTRFAPSPTGLLHLGHAHSALFGWKAARERDGVFLLRIEDIDPGRCRAEFERSLMEDLGWLGLTWPEPVRRQSDHLDDYRAALDRLGGMRRDVSLLLHPQGDRGRDRPRRACAAWAGRSAVSRHLPPPVGG